ncbi:MAG: hypothetical protein IPJ37_24545 [Bacteroidales bacterium]|nr:hypothetical protein [Bacteroidales bacterium]
MKSNIIIAALLILLAASSDVLYCQNPGKGRVAVIQATALPNQDLLWLIMIL